MRLTRWMADYYLCGWGQVLNAVVPAGARDKAGTRLRMFIEAVGRKETAGTPADQTSRRSPVSARGQSSRRTAEPTRRVRCGPGPIEALASKGLVRRITRRMDRFIDANEEPGEPDGPDYSE